MNISRCAWCGPDRLRAEAERKLEGQPAGDSIESLSAIEFEGLVHGSRVH